MFMVFMSNPLLQDIYARLHQLWASPSSVGSKLMFQISNSHLCASQKHSHTIQKPLKQTRILAEAAPLLNITPAGENKCLCPYSIKYRPAWHLRTNSRFQSTHCKTLCSSLREISCATLWRCLGGSVKCKLFGMDHLHFVINGINVYS